MNVIWRSILKTQSNTQTDTETQSTMHQHFLIYSLDRRQYLPKIAFERYVQKKKNTFLSMIVFLDFILYFFCHTYEIDRNMVLPLNIEIARNFKIYQY